MLPVTDNTSASSNAKPVTIRRASVGDLASVEELLARNKLPPEGVREAFDDFVVAECDGSVVGAVGLEVFGNAALLRSAVVGTNQRGTGLGTRLVENIISHARDRLVQSVYLLTTTAEDYFPRFGFTKITRGDVPAAVKESVEFRGVCPDSAVVMVYMLEPAHRT